MNAISGFKSRELITREVFVSKRILLNSPLRKCIVEIIESNHVAWLQRAKVLLSLEVRPKLSLHLELLIKLFDVVVDVLANEVGVVIHSRKVLEDALALELEEPSQLFYLRVLNEHLSVLQLCSLLGVVAHQVLCKEDARVESLSDTLIDSR